jgi:hypothetical protein
MNARDKQARDVDVHGRPPAYHIARAGIEDIQQSWITACDKQPFGNRVERERGIPAHVGRRPRSYHLVRFQVHHGNLLLSRTFM